MATADQMEREAKAAQAALAAMYNRNNPSATLATGNVYRPQYTTFPGAAEWGAARNAITTSGMGANRPSNPKTWESMTDYEKKAALDKVDWDSDFFKPKPSGGGQSSSSSSSSSTSASGPATETPITIMPVDTPSGGGNGGGRTETSNVDAIAKMYAEALAELQRQYGVSQENINAAIGRLRSDPYNTANAYANMQLADPRVAANPVAEYMAAAGMAPGQAAAAQQMAQAEADAYQRAMQNVQNILSTSRISICFVLVWRRTALVR
jgi:hypothetical protein